MRLLRTGGIVLLIGVAALMATFAMPIARWRTGEIRVPPLSLLPAGAAPQAGARIWVDTDAACGVNDRIDPDDCFALLALAHARNLRIAGISTVFGNAELDETDAITRELVAQLSQEGFALPAVHRGSAAAIERSDALSPSLAVSALRAALEKESLTIVALGPLTNIALALQDRPDLHGNIALLIAVMGRRPGHLFHPAEGRGEGMLFGHGPVFRDFNFAMDPSAVETLLQMGLRIVFVPYGAARQVELTQTDLESLSQRGGAAAWVAQRSRGWLHYWNTDVGRPGFYPFDLLGAAYAIDPRHLSCARVSAWIGEDRLLWHFPFTNPSALLIEQDAKRIGKDARPVQSFYCPAVDGRLKAQLQQWLRG